MPLISEAAGREKCVSLKSALHVTLGDQVVIEEVLRTLLSEIQGNLNSKHLGYIPSDIHIHIIYRIRNAKLPSIMMQLDFF